VGCRRSATRGSTSRKPGACGRDATVAALPPWQRVAPFAAPEWPMYARPPRGLHAGACHARVSGEAQRAHQSSLGACAWAPA
jgi:hypothetical protein